MIKISLRVPIVLTALGAALTASAGITTSNLADWKTAVGTYTEITFTEHPVGSNLGTAYDSLGVSFGSVSIQENTSGFPNPPTSDTRYGNVDAYTDWSVSFDGTVTDIALESPFGFGSFTGLAFWTADFRRNGVSVGSTFGPLTEGYRSTVPFDEIRFAYYGNNAGMAFDNFYFGPITPVPEPASCAALGLGCIALVRRRKRTCPQGSSDGITVVAGCTRARAARRGDRPCRKTSSRQTAPSPRYVVQSLCAQNRAV